MDSYTADTYTVDLSTLSSTGMTWDANYGAIPPNNIGTISVSPTVWTTTGTGTSGQWTITDSDLISPSSAKIQLNGENADIEINGRSLMQILDGLEQRLGLLKCREDLESDWSELRTLGDQYRAKLAEIENKNKMWDTLKS